MALTYQQIKLVKGTIPALREHGERITTIFYSTMLREHPQLNNYFNLINQKNGRQPRALTVVMLDFASNIMHISELIPKLERMCNKHCSLDIKPEHYAIVCKYLIRAFSEVLGPSMTPETEKAWTSAYWVLAKMMIGREAQLYKEFQGWIGWKKFKIEQKIAESEDIYSLYLVPEDQTRLPTFFPGQYISVQIFVPDIGFYQSRQFSLSDSPRPDYYRITVKRDQGLLAARSEVGAHHYKPGIVSNALIDNFQQGDIIDVSHPAGEFFFDTNNSSGVPLVLISAGVGVTPMVSILNTVAEFQSYRDISWIQGARSSVPFQNHIAQLKRRCPNLKTNIFKTHLAETDLAGVTHDYDFRIDLAKVNSGDLFLHHGGTEYYICGPEQFMTEMADYLQAQSVDLRRIKFELFSTGNFGL
ncbi:hypothetical protein B7463_g6830, partial [Scytalidium lignicola]